MWLDRSAYASLKPLMRLRFVVNKAARRSAQCLLMVIGLAWHGFGQSQEQVKPLVLLIGIDGFRADYLERGFSPNLLALAQKGLWAKGLVPVFPSLTFPNHLSLVTGVHPGRHGIVNNSMQDPMRSERFRLGATSVITDPFWWTEATPIWISLKRQGKRSATVFWPGSDVKIQGFYPDHWLPYQHAMPHEQRLSQLLQWLEQAQADRPDFATIYFSDVDSMGHAKGPDSDEVNQAIAKVDRSIGQLIAGLSKLGLLEHTSFVIAADHGMRFVPIVNTIDAEAATARFPKLQWQWFGASSGFDLKGESQADVLAELAQNPKLRCWPKSSLPEHFGAASHRRMPDVVCLAEPGYSVAPNRFRPGPLGQHGFDPDDEQMHGLLIASGYRIAQARLGTVSTLDVYPLLCALLGIVPEPHQGTEVLSRAGLLTKVP
ncbi:MAG: alkaline phosphatase family protein [Betaproteobacteria bacterium]|nr:alkaline phosphatase family protein [Betaproteobacteria bacterium]NDA72694.1 alkaline phosphatase family protein [Betaproteobacteria bacterium]